MYPQSVVVPLDGVSVAIRPAGGVDGAFWDGGRPSEENKAQSEDSQQNPGLVAIKQASLRRSPLPPALKTVLPVIATRAMV